MAITGHETYQEIDHSMFGSKNFFTEMWTVDTRSTTLGANAGAGTRFIRSNGAQGLYIPEQCQCVIQIYGTVRDFTTPVVYPAQAVTFTTTVSRATGGNVTVGGTLTAVLGTAVAGVQVDLVVNTTTQTIEFSLFDASAVANADMAGVIMMNIANVPFFERKPIKYSTAALASVETSI